MHRSRRRGAATAAAIEDAALDLALEQGYENVTVSDICDAVGISQRAFFNHFPTKDDALLGRELPRIDEKAARRFVLATGPLLSDAMTLLTQDEMQAPHSRVDERIRVISASPALLARQMERISSVQDELIEIVLLRIRHQKPAISEEDALARATMVVHLLAGVMRFVSSEAKGEGDLAARVERTTRVLNSVLADSVPTEI